MAESERPTLAALSEEHRRQALERFQVLRPFLEEGMPLATVARAHAISPRTARYWVRQYRQHGLAGLVRRPRSDRGRHHLPDALAGLIEGLALRRAAAKPTMLPLTLLYLQDTLWE